MKSEWPLVKTVFISCRQLSPTRLCFVAQVTQDEIDYGVIIIAAEVNATDSQDASVSDTSVASVTLISSHGLSLGPCAFCHTHGSATWSPFMVICTIRRTAEGNVPNTPTNSFFNPRNQVKKDTTMERLSTPAWETQSPISSPFTTRGLQLYRS